MMDYPHLGEGALIPVGFEVLPDGVYKVFIDSSGKVVKNVFISGHIVVICHWYDSLKKLWAIGVIFNTFSGDWMEMKITMKELHGADRALIQKLASFGLHIIPGMGKYLRKYLGSFEVKEIREWYPDISTEVLKGLNALRDFILMNAEHFADPKENHEGAQIGYYNESKGLYLLTAGVLQEVIGDVNLQDLLEELRRRNLIFRNENDRNLSKHTIAGNGRSSFYTIREAILEDASIGE